MSAANATVILQARLGSTRLPGKVLLPMAGKPMLHYTVATLKQSGAVGRIVLATTTLAEDDRLAEFAKTMDIGLYRGSVDDVLDRYYQAARLFPAAVYLRATGDNPIIDSKNPERSLQAVAQRPWDYCCESGMPVGSVLEAFTWDALERTHHETTRAYDREHVTWYTKKSGRFRAFFPPCPLPLQAPDMWLTVDTPADFARVSLIVAALYQNDIPDFAAVLDWLRPRQSQYLRPNS